MKHEKLLRIVKEAMGKPYRRREYEKQLMFNEIIKAAHGEEITIRLRRLNKKGSGA